MSVNPAIHRRPSGDVDIALPTDEPEPSRDAPPRGSNNASVDGGFTSSPTTTE
ncbi:MULTISPECIES: hypothetical protein [Pseudofrankia]|uniref:hypothetical protein n=1 Tax=Pseudofrankia TaxID=2994363 RepID=UPI0012FF1C5B|nr:MULTISPECIES: hypothetical protein [Pseudofrankia]